MTTTFDPKASGSQSSGSSSGQETVTNNALDQPPIIDSGLATQMAALSHHQTMVTMVDVEIPPTANTATAPVETASSSNIYDVLITVATSLTHLLLKLMASLRTTAREIVFSTSLWFSLGALFFSIVYNLDRNVTAELLQHFRAVSDRVLPAAITRIGFVIGGGDWREGLLVFLQTLFPEVGAYVSGATILFDR